MFALSPLPRTLPAALRDARAAKPDVRRSALRDLVRHAVGERRSEVVACLESVLAGDADPAVRAEAAMALADAAAGEALAALLAATEDAHLRVRQLALVAIGELGEPGDPLVRAALEAARHHEAPALRYQALIGLARTTPGGATELLLAATRDPDAAVRHVAVRLLEERLSIATEGGPRAPRLKLPPGAEPRLRALLRDDAPRVRLAAAILLARCGVDAGFAAIAAAVNAASGSYEADDEHAAVELAGAHQLAAARRGLTRRAFGRFGFSLDPTALAARIALARCGDPRAVGAILRGLGARTREARTLAALAAGRARLEAARPLLRALRGAPDRADPAVVEEALAQLDATVD